jgi:hypothetical protein
MADHFRERLARLPEVAGDPLLRELVIVLSSPTGVSSAGWPYLSGHVWARFRDWVPHLLGDGQRVLDGVARIEALAADASLSAADQTSLSAAVRVVRQVVRTSAVTAPPELWLLRHVLSALERRGILERWRQGEIVYAADVVARPEELKPDLELLLARHFVGRSGEGYRWIDLPTPRRVLNDLGSLPEGLPSDLSVRWCALFEGRAGHPGASDDTALLEGVLDQSVWAPPGGLEGAVRGTPAWVPEPTDLELGWRLVPLVLGLRAANRIAAILEAGRVDGELLAPLSATLRERVCALFRAVGAIQRDGSLTAVGVRLLSRGPGPFGIIETYHPYLAQLERIWDEGRGAVHVERGANVAASQDANRRTFAQANDALDTFCGQTGFAYDVFVEHAVGRGEATRQRFARSGATLTYVGADLEDAAIDAAMSEQQAGRLPANMRFVRNADIGRSEILIERLRAWGLDTEGAVMLVGNGFHEVRDQPDERMVAVFEGYERAGFVLLFTEESALSVDDLLETAWNTYHGAFRYVHERSGQTLRPAAAGPPSQLGAPLPASWTECAVRAGYVRVAAHSKRGRTIHPYPPATGSNPAISVNHFFVPGRIAQKLGI